MPDERLIVGAMSGTSGDGVDAVLAEIIGRGLDISVRPLAHHHVALTPEVRSLLFAIREKGECKLGDLARLGRQITLAYADAVQLVLRKTQTQPDAIACVAAHGQTLYHAPPDTIQYFDPSLLACQIGCPVISDFRRADCAAGGQGAPLVPYADYVLFRHPTQNRVLLNVGGIANLTYLRAGGTLDDVIAFDTGPGNCISDALCRRHDPSGPGFDRDGETALSGNVNLAIVQRCLEDDFFHRWPPKSTDGPAMIGIFDREIASESAQLSFADQLATAIEITARSIFAAMPPDGDIFISGGGCLNQLLMRRLRAAGLTIRTIDQTGLSVDVSSREALAFAILGAATLDGVPGNIPSVTGAVRPVVLGSITPKP